MQIIVFFSNSELVKLKKYILIRDATDIRHYSVIRLVLANIRFCQIMQAIRPDNGQKNIPQLSCWDI
jgi:hypothetical protein